MNYMNYYETKMHHYGYIHEDELPNAELITQCLKDCVEALYEDGDVSKLETAIYEICAQYEVAVPETDYELKIKGS